MTDWSNLSDWLSRFFNNNGNYANAFSEYNNLDQIGRIATTSKINGLPAFTYGDNTIYFDGNNVIDNNRNKIGTINVDGSISPIESNILGLKNGWADLGQLGLGALNTGFNIYGGLKQLGLAKDQLNFTKDAFNTNLANSIKSYNTALEDRARSRYAYMTGDASNADDYINKHKL